MRSNRAEQRERTRDNRPRRIAEVAAAQRAPYAAGARRGALLRRKIVGCREEQAVLEARVAELEREARRLSARYAEAEARSTHFAHLYLTVHRLRSARGRAEILAALREIAEGIVGAAELAVFERGDDGAALRLGGAWGTDAPPCVEAPEVQRVVAGVLATGEAYWGDGGAGDAGEGASVAACVPLAVEGRRLGALALLRLLPQKPALSGADREVLELLSVHAAAALRDSAGAEPARGETGA